MDRYHIEELKHRLNPEDVASLLNIRKRGKRYFCPICQPQLGKTPDLVIDECGFHCFKCGLKGDIIDLIMSFGQMSFSQALELLETNACLSIPSRSRGINQKSKPESIISDSLKSKILMAFLDSCKPVQAEALSWLVDEKGVSPEVIESCNLRVCGSEYKKIMEEIVERFGQVDVHKAGLLKPSGKKPGYFVPVFWHYYASEIDFLIIPYLKNERP